MVLFVYTMASFTLTWCFWYSDFSLFFNEFIVYFQLFQDAVSRISDNSQNSNTSAELNKSLTQIDEEKPKAVSKVSERAKKKAWYSVLYPSYKSRTEDFKKLFKGVPDDERLVVGEN